MRGFRLMNVLFSNAELAGRAKGWGANRVSAKCPSAKRRAGRRSLWQELEPRQLLSVSVVNSYAGSGVNGWIPADTMGAVGPAHVMDFINDQVVIRNKSNGSALVTETGDQFWANAGVSGVAAYDNRVVYDPVSQRWFASSDIDQGKSNSRLIVGVSLTSDPTQGWKAFTFASNSSGYWGDYPTLGLDANGVYMAANLFSTGSNSYGGSRVYAINKGAMLSFASGSAVPGVTAWAVSPNGTMTPTYDFNASKSATAPAYVINRDGGGIDVRTITWNGTTPTLSGASLISIGGTNGAPVNGTQPGTNSQVLDSGDGRLISALVTNSSSTLWTVVPTTIGGHAAGVWAQVNLNTRSVVQSGQVADATADILYPAIAANDNGDAVVGYTKVSSSQYASVYVNGRLGSDAAGTLEGQVLVKAGGGTYTDNGGAGTTARWGDYSMTWVDPSDATKFWTIQEYAVSSSAYQFGTYWGQVSLGGAPAAPSGFTATGTSTSTMHLAWTDNANNETGYQIERSSDGGQSYALVTTTAANATSYDDSGLAAATTYTYRLTALGTTGNSSSVTASGTTQAAATVPNAPSNLAATAASNTQINLTWTDNSTNETGFKIYRSTDGSNYTLLPTQAPAGATSYADTGLAAGQQYWYYVVATNATGDSGASNTANATTPNGTAPNAPSSLAASGVSRGTIALTWQDNATNESGFYIERSNDGVSGWTQIGSVGANVTSYTANGLKKNATYFFRVRAYNASGTSAYSNVASAVAPNRQSMMVYSPEADWPELLSGPTSGSGVSPVGDAQVVLVKVHGRA